MDWLSFEESLVRSHDVQWCGHVLRRDSDEKLGRALILKRLEREDEGDRDDMKKAGGSTD